MHMVETPQETRLIEYISRIQAGRCPAGRDIYSMSRVS